MEGAFFAFGLCTHAAGAPIFIRKTGLWCTQVAPGTQASNYHTRAAQRSEAALVTHELN